MKTVTHVSEDCQLCPQTKQGEGLGVRAVNKLDQSLDFVATK